MLTRSGRFLHSYTLLEIERGRLEPPETRSHVRGLRRLRQARGEEAPGAAILDGGEQTARAGRARIGGPRARQRSPRPGQDVRGPAPLRLFSPRLAPGLTGRNGHQDARSVPEGPPRRTVGPAVLDHAPDRQSQHALGLRTPRWGESGAVRLQVRAALRTGVRRLRDHARPRPPQVAMPPGVPGPLGWLGPLGLGTTPRPRWARGGALRRDALGRGQGGQRAPPGGGIGAIRPRTAPGGVLRTRMLGPALYDKSPTGARPKPG